MSWQVCRRFAVAVIALAAVAPAFAQDAGTPAAAAKTSANISLTALVDGKDDLRITRTGLEWIHLDGVWPKDVILNGHPWEPQRRPQLTGDDLAVYFRDGFALGDFELATRTGRGEIKMYGEEAGAVRLELADGEAGAGPYEIALRRRDLSWLAQGEPQQPKEGLAKNSPGSIRITATIEGTDRVLIYPDHLEWQHQAQAWPQSVKVNGIAWSPKDNPRLENSGETTYLKDEFVHVGTTLRRYRGRNRTEISTQTNHIALQFGDTDPGSDVYEVAVYLGEAIVAIEPSDELKQRIAELWAQSRKRPHPTAADAPCWRDFDNLRRNWNRSRLGRAYEKYGRRDPKWDEAALAFLEREALLENEEVPSDQMIEAGYKLIDLGCDDPVVCHVLAHRLYRASRFSEAERLAMHAVLQFEKLKYPPRTSRLAPALLGRVLLAEPSRSRETAFALLERADVETVATLREPLQSDERRGLFNEIRQGFSTNGMFSGQQAFLARLVSETSESDPWLYHMILGDYQYRQAWEAAGSGRGTNVGAYGWNTYETLMTQAKFQYATAWFADPRHPEPSERLIMIIRMRGTVTGELPRFWFDQAVATQLDAPGVHETMVMAMSPLWGSTHERMLQYGLECVETRRFDTIVPETIFSVLRQMRVERVPLVEFIAQQNAGDEIRKAMRDITRDQTGAREVHLRTLALVAAWVLGWRDEAQSQWAALKGALDEDVLKAWRLDPKALRMDLDYPLQPFAEARVVEPVGTLFEQRGSIVSLAVAPDGQHVAVATQRNNAITLWDVASGQSQEVKARQAIEMALLRYAPDSKLIAGMQYDGRDPNRHRAQVVLWNTDERVLREFAPKGHDALVKYLAWLPEGRYLALALPDRALIADSQTGNVVAATPVLKQPVVVVAVAPATRLLAVGCANGLIQLFRMPPATHLAETDEPLVLASVGELNRHQALVNLLAFSADGKALASCSHSERSIWLWDTSTRQTTFRLTGAAMAFSPDGTRLATAGGENLKSSAVLWNVKSGQALTRCACPDGTTISDLAFTVDGEFLIAPATDGTIYTWQAK